MARSRHLYFSNRHNGRLQSVPTGEVTVTIIPRNSNTPISHQLVWDNSSDYETAGYKENPHGIGNKYGYLPSLGTKISSSDDSSIFESYIYKNSNSKIIGFIRIPSYVPENIEDAVREFTETVGKFEDTTDALIIDQTNNPGGSLFYGYYIASLLTSQPLKTPKHQFMITRENVSEAINQLEILNNIKTDEDAKKVFGERNNGLPNSLQIVNFLKNYYKFILDQYNKGVKRTVSYYMYGVDHINPSSNKNYSKPIVVLVNSLCISMGDFIPAILQDNKRATIVGTRTSGAGGLVSDVEYPNIFGLQSFGYTWTIAHRLDGKPIENLGVTPDIELKHTVNDLNNNYIDYTQSLNKIVDDIITKQAK